MTLFSKQAILKYCTRFFILYALSVVFKSFDLTFPKNIGGVFLRGQTFSIMFAGFGLAAWYIAEKMSAAIERKFRNRSISQRVLLLGCSLFFYGFAVAYTFSFCYAMFDVIFFKRYEAWQSFSSFSYDLIFGIFIFYLLILGYNGIIFYYKNWKLAQLNTEKLMRENIQAKYDVLRNQIEPHFFFNSLSVLTQLVYKSPDISAEYITQLAKTYRYILDKKFENLVSVQTELDFLESYAFLINIRHENAILFEITIDDFVKKSGLMPPATLQMLTENAVKHNRFAADNPLHIRIKSEGDFIYVTNDLRKRNNGDSIGMGLDNIVKRYELACNRQIEITETADLFIVKVPVIYTGQPGSDIFAQKIINTAQ